MKMSKSLISDKGGKRNTNITLMDDSKMINDLIDVYFGCLISIVLMLLELLVFMNLLLKAIHLIAS